MAGRFSNGRKVQCIKFGSIKQVVVIPTGTSNLLQPNFLREISGLLLGDNACALVMVNSTFEATPKEEEGFALVNTDMDSSALMHRLRWNSNCFLIVLEDKNNLFKKWSTLVRPLRSKVLLVQSTDDPNIFNMGQINGPTLWSRKDTNKVDTGQAWHSKSNSTIFKITTCRMRK